MFHFSRFTWYNRFCMAITPSHGRLKMPLFTIWSVVKYVWFTCTYALVLPQTFWVLYLAKNTYTSQTNWMPLVSFLFITDYNQLKFSLTAPVGESHQSRALALGLTCGGSMSCYEFRTSSGMWCLPAWEDLHEACSLYQEIFTTKGGWWLCCHSRQCCMYGNAFS